MPKDMTMTKPTCGICGKFLFDLPKCPGHGVGDASQKEKASQDDGKANSADQTMGAVGKKAADSNSLVSPLSLNEKMFNPEIISALLSSKLLVIDNNRELGTLTIKLQCDLNCLSPEQRNELKKYVDVILKELDEFKKENNLSANCKIFNQGLSLRITLPTLAAYDAFIQRLASKNLLPMQNIQQQKEKVVYQEGINHFNLTPFSTKPKSSAKNVKSEEEAHQTTSIRPKSPLDGLKPKGWK